MIRPTGEVDAVAGICYNLTIINGLDFTRFLSGGFYETLDNIGRNAL